MSDQTISLDDLYRLTSTEYDRAQADAEARLKQEAGNEPPQRREFRREQARKWVIQDTLAAIILIAAWAVSTLHVMTLVGKGAAASYGAISLDAYVGDIMDSLSYGRIHQWGYIALAEAAMILFMTMHLSRNKRGRYPDEPLWLYNLRMRVTTLSFMAVLSGVFIFYANVTSGIGVLESIIPPIMTIGLGIYFEGRLAGFLLAVEDTDRRYMAALDAWEQAHFRPREHVRFRELFAQELAQRLNTKNKNRVTAGDIPPQLLYQAVQREYRMRERMQRALDAEGEALEAGAEATRPLSAGSFISLPSNGSGSP